MNERQLLMPHVELILDDTGGAIRVDDRKLPQAMRVIGPDCWLIGWQADAKVIVVAVRSYIADVLLTREEAEEAVVDYMVEKGMFASEPDIDSGGPPDYVIGPEKEVS